MSELNMQLFRAYDIRGSVQDLSPQAITAIALALCEDFRQAGQTRLTLGYDARLDSPHYAQIIADVFLQAGFDVCIIGQCSTPLMYFTAQSFDGNGIMVTASHNPKKDNGIKWIRQSLPATAEHIQHIGKQAQHFWTQAQHFRPTLSRWQFAARSQLTWAYQQYQQWILQDIQLQRSFRVVLDGLHGSAGRIAQRLLQALGCHVICLRCHADGHFPDHAPDPSIARHLTRIQQQVIAQNADLGIALDGDGDRLVLIDEHGSILNADRSLCLFAEICLQHPHGKKREFIYDVKCSNMVQHTVERLAGQATMIRTGSSFLRSYLQHHADTAIFAGEFSGHYAFADGRGLAFDDAIYAALRVMEYLSQTQRSLADVMQQYPIRASSEDIYLAKHGYDFAHLSTALQQFAQQCHAHVRLIDGIRLDFAHGFMTLR
ncbi:MAG: phosphomannomutase/phosphoglucomutase, partial [Acinetobacter sp.]|nr:phosphomannomutase/phosphoglucomutase [Acinetobacter sp.]